MKYLSKLLVCVCCVGLLAVACGEEENGENGDDNGDADMACVMTCDGVEDCPDEDNWACEDDQCVADMCDEDADCEDMGEDFECQDGACVDPDADDDGDDEDEEDEGCETDEDCEGDMECVEV